MPLVGGRPVPGLRADRRVTSSLWNPLTSGSSEDFNNFKSSQIAQKGMPVDFNAPPHSQAFEQRTCSRRQTRAEVQRLVSEFFSSGMRQNEFCSGRGFSLSTLARHLKKRRCKRRPFCHKSNNLRPSRLAMSLRFKACPTYPQSRKRGFSKGHWGRPA